ncbi:lytic transglycosylase domain-containing protein [Microvirgula aerodenitrificans]|uniref:lytic transglycosylase domain-containing protein n=1 Tax=Microvirgula aerodenitrificans TaxID=57480 RepID=UPI0028EBABFA|nr:lytic transglycosylase domain-containing protein [Microvirgula aerodenitrificans]
MADAVTIKDFLVSLGFKIDEKGLKNFSDGIDTATKSVVRLVTTITGASLAVAAGVAAFAFNLEGLYFASQRVGASATNIKAVEYAARNLGASGEEARGTMESLARFVRENPGGEGWLNAIGVQTRKANGEMMDMSDQMVGIAKRFREMDYWQAKPFADTLGISENMLMAMRNGEFEKNIEAYRKKANGSDLDKAARESHQLMIRVRDLREQLWLIGAKVEESILQKAVPALERFAKWFDSNQPMIYARIDQVMKLLQSLAETLGPAFGWLLDKFIELDGATDGWSTKVFVLLGALKMLGGFAIVSGVTKMAGALFGLGSAATAANAAGTTLIGTLLRLVTGPAAAGIALLFHSEELNAGEEDSLRAMREKYAKEKGLSPQETEALSGRKPVGTPATAPPQSWGGEAARMGARHGATGKNPAASALFARLEKQYGLEAGLLDSMWLQESGRGKRMLSAAGAQGHFQFMPATAKQWGLKDPNNLDESADAAARYMKWLLNQTGGNLRDALAAYNGGIGRLKRVGFERMPWESRNYSPQIMGRLPQQQTAQSSQAAGNNVQVTQNTTVNVNGAGDPNATARAVAGEQDRVASDAYRMLQGAAG